MGRLVKGCTALTAGLMLAAGVGGCGTVPPAADADTAVAERVGNVAAVKTIWSDPERAWVRLVQAESGGGGYDQPVRVDRQWLRQTLYDLKVREGDRDDGRPDARVFQPEQLDLLVPALVRGLAEAGPQQAVAFAVAARRGGFAFFDPVRLSTARVFVIDGELNVLFGRVAEPLSGDKVRQELERAPVGTRERRFFRDKELRSRSWGAGWKREDWLTVEIETGDGPLPELPASQGAAQAPAAAQGPEAGDGAASRQEAPEQPRRAPGGVRERLETLEGLHADGLISDQEYKRKRQEILDDL